MGSLCSKPGHSPSKDVGLNKTVEVQPKKTECRNASEALLVEMMQKVEREEIELVKMFGTLDDVRELYDDLKEILAILRLREECRVLNYDVCDAVVLAQDLIDFYNATEKFLMRGTHISRCVGAVKARMLSSDSNIRPGDAGEADMMSTTNDGEDVVGFENVIKMLLERVILNEDPRTFKLSIEGIAGAGKTTLVRKMYSHEWVVDRFKCRAWLTVPSDFSHKGVLMKLIQQVVDSDDDDERSSMVEKMMHSDIPTLQQMLHQHLLGRQYLIVIDDVPEEMDLDIIYKGLPTEDGRSKLLLTSRFENTQSYANRHKMITLNSDASWELFTRTIFGGNKFTREHEFPKQLERKAKEMLTSRCGGVPSAIKNVGVQVARMRESGREWEQLLDSIDFDATLGFLEESYQNFDRDTKLCFLHLACFKENAVVRSEELEHVLNAAVVGLEGRSLPCLAALVERSFMEVVEEKVNIEDRSCRINVLLHGLAVKKAKEEIGFEILSNDGDDTRRSSTTPRHRVVKCSRDDMFDYSSTIQQEEHLVSLFFHGGGSYLDDLQLYWKSFVKLKILNLEDFGLKILPEGIGLLTELTYLGLRNNYIRALPRSLGRLKKLEVLDITENFMVEVPDVIWGMDSLLHLYISDILCPEPLKLDAQSRLLTLTYASIDNWACLIPGSEETGIGGLTRLGIQGLDESSDISKLFATLAKLTNLRRLTLKGLRFERMPCLDELDTLECAQLKVNGFLARLPRSFPPYVRFLSLVNSRLDEDPMPVLRKLPGLHYLKLKNAYNGSELEIPDGELPQLCILRIKDMRHLRNLRVGKGAMALLEKLEISSCPYLETLPEELGSMSKLLELKMVTTKTIERKIRKLGFISKLFVLAFHYPDKVVHV